MPQQFQNDHVVLTQRLICLASTNDVTDESRPVCRPFKLQYLYNTYTETINYMENSTKSF